MSYARFGWDGSDVYVFMAVEGWLECCACQLPSGGSRCFHAYTTDGMVDHLKAHIAAGQCVPKGVVHELITDDAQNFPQNAKSRAQPEG